MKTINRRSFISQTVLGSAAVTLSPHVLLAATRKPKEKLGVALGGVG